MVKRDKKMGDRGHDMQQRSQTEFKSKMLLLYMASALGNWSTKTVKEGPLNPTLPLPLSEYVHNMTKYHVYADSYMQCYYFAIL